MLSDRQSELNSAFGAIFILPNRPHRLHPAATKNASAVVKDCDFSKKLLGCESWKGPGG
jgi:hypothetical protein